MNPQIVRPGNIAAAAVVIGGALVLVLPQHSMSIVRLMIVTVAAAAGLYALGLNAPPVWWRSPFDRRPGSEREGHGSGEIAWIRSKLSGRRQRIPHGPPLPPEVLRLLRPLVEVAFERAGIVPGDGVGPDSAHVALSPRILAVLMSDPRMRPGWFRMLRPDPTGTAAAVHAILDELEGLEATARDPNVATREPRAT